MRPRFPDRAVPFPPRIVFFNLAHCACAGHTVSLPGTERVEAAEPAATKKPVCGPDRRVLVVDDNVDGAESLATLVGLWGHEVRIAHDGPSALITAAEFRPDAVLLDIGLPGLDGYKVARQLRARPGSGTTKPVALTGWGRDADRERPLAAGFDLHLVKPVDPAEPRKVLSAPGG